MKLNEKIKAPPIRDVLRVAFNKKEWSSKSPYEKWCHLYSVGRVSLDVLGFPVYHEKRVFRWYTWVFFVYLSIDTLGVLYTGYCYMLSGEFSEFLPCTILFAGPLVCSAPMGYQAATSKGCALFNSLVDFGGYSIHPDYRTDTDLDRKNDREYTKICSVQIDETVRNLIIKMIMMTLAMLSFNVGPIYSYFTYGTKTTMTNVKVPYTETYSNQEFAANVLLSAVIGIHGYIGYIGLEVSMALFSDVVTITPKLIEYALNGLIKRNEEKSISTQELSFSFRNIIRQSLDADEYLTCISNLLYVRTFITPSLFTYSIGLGIFCQYMMGYSAGYGMALISLVQFFYVCEFGEDIEDNGFTEMLYTTNWYTLPIKYQLDIAHLIHRKQNGVKITIGPFGTINRERFDIVTHKVYSFVMFLLNFGFEI